MYTSREIGIRRTDSVCSCLSCLGWVDTTLVLRGERKTARGGNTGDFAEKLNDRVSVSLLLNGHG